MNDYNYLSEKSLKDGKIEQADIIHILEGEVNLLQLLDAAYKVRYHYFKNGVRLHVINNVKSGGCSEDCSYCAQSHKSENDAPVYSAKSREQDLEEAKTAFENGAYRYCMVFSGRRQKKADIQNICDTVKAIRSHYPIEICVSAGFLDGDDAKMLKDAGVGRYNHNINTSSEFYKDICTTHDYEDRLNTIRIAKKADLDICSGVIIGMGETSSDIIQMIEDLRSVDAKAVPVNFFIPVDGHRIKQPLSLTPEYCLRILCLFRFMLPSSEIRIAGGREHHLRGMQSLSLYPANSLFAKGYLTEGGDSFAETRQMIADAGFVLESVEN